MPVPPTRRSLVAALTGLVLVVVLVGGGAVAGAHTQVLRAVPGPGQVVTTAPERVDLAFAGPILPGITIDVSTEQGATVPGLTPPSVSVDGLQASTSFAPLAPGAYVVDYRFTSTDRDTQRQTYRFTYRPPRPDTPDRAGRTAEIGAGAAIAVLLAGLGLSLWRRREMEADNSDS